MWGQGSRSLFPRLSVAATSSQGPLASVSSQTSTYTCSFCLPLPPGVARASSPHLISEGSVPPRRPPRVPTRSPGSVAKQATLAQRRLEGGDRGGVSPDGGVRKNTQELLVAAGRCTGPGTTCEFLPSFLPPLIHRTFMEDLFRALAGSRSHTSAPREVTLGTLTQGR